MTTTNGVAWVDRRAARDTAAAARVQADAAGLIAEQQAADLAADRAHRHDMRQEQRRDRRIAERATRRAERAAAWKARRAVAVAGLPRLVEVIACASPTAIAFRGQLAFASGPMHLGGMAVLFPITLEGVAWALAWRRHGAIEKDQPTGLLTITMWALALTAAGMNVWHGAEATPATADTPARDGSLQVGFGFGVASLVGFILIEVIAGARRAASTATNKLGLARWLRYFPLAFSAWSYRVAAGTDCTWGQAWAHAWVDSGRVAPKPAVEQLPVEQDEELDDDTTELTTDPADLPTDPADLPELVAAVQPSRMRTWTPTSRPTTRRYRTTSRKVHTLRPSGQQHAGEQTEPTKTVEQRVGEGAGWPTIRREFGLSESQARAAVRKHQHLRTNTTEAEEGQA